ncbi:MAG: VOC family protein [Caldilineaceae bacterium]|nr:VOC family protein [Caldilineaceae bacterium]
MITTIHHVQITVPRHAEKTARAFYCDLLGLPELEKPAALAARGGFWVQVGPLQLHIGTEEGVDRAATKAHVAYLVTDLALWRTRLATHGITILESIPIPGYDRFECRDPFDNRLEFIQAIG